MGAQARPRPLVGARLAPSVAGRQGLTVPGCGEDDPELDRWLAVQDRIYLTHALKPAGVLIQLHVVQAGIEDGQAHFDEDAMANAMRPGLPIVAPDPRAVSLGGSETAGLQLAAELVRRGHRVTVTEGPRNTHGVVFRRSHEPRSRLQRAFELTNIPSRSTVEPGFGGYPANFG